VRNLLGSGLDWPAEGICFDIEHNGFRREEWGARPRRSEDAFTVGRAKIGEAPTLIPIYSHRYIPEEPPMAGTPVFSVYQTDIIHYGNDLPSYFAAEFHADPDRLPEYHITCPDWAVKSPRPIRFWDCLL